MVRASIRLFMKLTRSYGSGARRVRKTAVGLSPAYTHRRSGVTVATTAAEEVFLDSPAPGRLALCQGRYIQNGNNREGFEKDDDILSGSLSARRKSGGQMKRL